MSSNRRCSSAISTSTLSFSSFRFWISTFRESEGFEDFETGAVRIQLKDRALASRTAGRCSSIKFVTGENQSGIIIGVRSVGVCAAVGRPLLSLSVSGAASAGISSELRTGGCARRSAWHHRHASDD